MPVCRVACRGYSRRPSGEGQSLRPFRRDDRAAALLMASFGWPTAWLLYPSLTLMIAVSIWDLVSTPKRRLAGAA